MEEQKTRRTDEQMTNELQESRQGIAIGKLCAALGIILVILGMAKGPSVPMIVIGAVILGVGQRMEKQKKDAVQRQIHDTLAQEILQTLLEDVSFEPSAHLGYQIVEESGIPLIRHTDVEGSEYAKGRYHGQKVELSSIRLIERGQIQRDESEGGMWEETEDTVYSGQWMICRYETSFPVSLTIYPRGRLDKIFHSATISTGVESFDQRFHLSADEEQKAIQFLEPTRMKKFLSLADTAGGGVSLGIRRDGTMYLAVQSGHGFFDPGKGREDAAELRRKFTEELKWFLEVVDVFQDRWTG